MYSYHPLVSLYGTLSYFIIVSKNLNVMSPSLFNLLQQFFKNLSPEERAMCKRIRKRNHLDVWKKAEANSYPIYSLPPPYFMGTGGWRWGVFMFWGFSFFGGWGGDVKKRLSPLEVNSLGHCVMKRKHWVHKNGWDVAIIVRGSSERLGCLFQRDK